MTLLRAALLLPRITPHCESFVSLQRARHGDHPDARGSGAAQHAGALGSGRAGGKDVVHQQDVAVRELRWIDHRESATQILAPLMPGQSDLRPGLALANQHTGAKLEPIRAGQLLERDARDQVRLVEAALGLLARMQRNRDDLNGALWQRSLEGGDGVPHHAPEHRRGGTNLLILEQVDQVAQAAVVASVSHCPLERRMQALAESAESAGAFGERRREQCFSADAAERSLERTERAQAVFTNGKTGNPNQRRTTDTTVGGKKRKKDTRGDALCPAGEPMVRCVALGSPYSKPSTAEDGLPQPGKAAGLPPGYSIASIAAARKFMQRDGQAKSWPRTHLAAAWQEVRPAQVPEQCGRRSRDDSNGRSEPAAAGEEEARISQRNRAGGSDTLAGRRIPGSEIPEKTVPTTEEQEETRHTPRGQSFHYKPGERGIVAAIDKLMICLRIGNNPRLSFGKEI